MTPLRLWPSHLRLLAAAFMFVSVAGYAAGLAFMAHNTSGQPQGVVDHYAGNEAEMQFGKSGAEMLEIVHTHLLGMGLLFFATGVLFAFTDFPRRFKGVVMVDTMLTLLTTFGSLWLVSLGWSAALWILGPSSVLMVAGFGLMAAVIIWNCFTPGRRPPAAQTS
jgi:hypothetical protein